MPTIQQASNVLQSTNDLNNCQNNNNVKYNFDIVSTKQTVFDRQ